MSYPCLDAFIVIVYLLDYDWIFDILALIGIVTGLFCELLLRGEYSENKCKRTIRFSFVC